MLFRVRRARRIVAVLLGVLSPAAAGTILPAIDPCPVDMPWMVQTAAADEHAGHGGSAAPASPHDGHSVCHCLSACVDGSSTPLPPGTSLLVALELASDEAPLPGRSTQVAPERPRYLLPPSQAPPVA